MIQAVSCEVCGREIWTYPGVAVCVPCKEGGHYYGDTCLGGHGELADIEAREADHSDGDQRPILCAHADVNGDGAHWLQPGERCELNHG